MEVAIIKDNLDGLAQRLKHARIEKNLTLDEAAAILKINKSTINRCETGKQIPDAKYLFQFEEFSDRSVAWLMTGYCVDETAFSLKENNYLTLIAAISTLLARNLEEKKLKLKWQYYGKVVRMLFQMSLEMVHCGEVDINNERWLQSEISYKLQSDIDQMFSILEGNIFEVA